MEQFMTLLGQYCFPICMCVAFFWWMIKKDKAHSEDIANLDTKHQETISKMCDTIDKNTQAINAMTLVTTQLAERLKVTKNE